MQRLKRKLSFRQDGFTSIHKKDKKFHAWVDLSSKNLKNIPNIDFKTRGINLSDNPINLGEELKEFIYLEYLDLSNCHLISLPKVFSCLEGLKELVLTKNSLSSLPLLPMSLEKLDISFNMFISLPEHLNTLVNLNYLYCEGNPLKKSVESVVKLTGKAPEGTILLDKKLPMSRIRFTTSELEILGRQYLSLADVSIDAITLEKMQEHLQIQHADDPLFIDRLFHVFTKSSSKIDQLDLQGFLFSMGILLKGTVKEKLQFVFDIYNRKGSTNFFDLDDYLSIGKSSLLSMALLMESIFVESDPSSTNSSVKVQNKEIDLALESSGKIVSEHRTSNTSVTTATFQHHWPVLKDLLTKQFKEIDQSGKGKVVWEDFEKYFFPRFHEIEEFLMFYATVFKDEGFTKCNVIEQV